MVFEEYCSYILSREPEIKDFTIPGSTITIDKSDLLSNMKKILRDNGDKDYEYDRLLVNTLKYFVDKEHLEKSTKLDVNMDAIVSNIQNRVEQIYVMCKSMDRKYPFSYERVFEILVYYLRLITNILDCEKEPISHYHTAGISPNSVAYFFDRRASVEDLSEEWEKKGWSIFNKDSNPLFIKKLDSYMRFILLSTYIRYCEIMDN